MVTPFYKDVFFWALVASLAIVLEFLVFLPNKRYPRWVYRISGVIALSTFEVVRFFIPYFPQPKIFLPDWLRYLGLLLFFLGVIIMVGAFVQIMQAKRENWKLRTTGFYSLVRHPLYFGDVLWNFGWCVYKGSVYGIWLTLVWIFLRYTLSVLEEEKLLQKYGFEYQNYAKKVKHRVVPFIL